ncbi:MAG: hypothetical protein ACOYIR_07030 [Christensenellales bacterium]
MKILRLRKRRLVVLAILLCLCAYFFINIAGYWTDCPYISVLPAMKRADNFEVRSQLLMEAMHRVGACDPTEAAEIWASGLVQRSAALQYAVMDAQLKAQYAQQLETESPNWVTGLSSPWVASYQIIKTESPDEDTRILELVFSTATSTGPAGDYHATLKLKRQGNFWRITNIAQDDGLFPYTLFTP